MYCKRHEMTEMTKECSVVCKKISCFTKMKYCTK